MAQPLPVSRLTIWQLAIPLRGRFEHAAAQRTIAEPVVVAVELANRVVGYGETHPRPYVSGESPDDVIRTIRDFFLPRLLHLRPANFGEAIEAAAALPLRDNAGRVITAARAAVELALLDAYSRAFGRSLENLAGWLSDSWLGPPGSSALARFGGVLSAMDPSRIPWSIRKMRLIGLRDFKLKVGDERDDARLNAALRALGRRLVDGHCTLRLDANGAWSLDEASERLKRWQCRPLLCVEQPLPKKSLHEWPALAARTTLPLMADESLVTPEDADDLIRSRAASWFNIRISKNGGLIPAMRLALRIRSGSASQEASGGESARLRFCLGCLVGETSILSAAARWFLRLVPEVPFAEGNFGRFLLKDDVIARPLRFSFGGRWKPQTGPGLGVEVLPERLQTLQIASAIVLPL